MKSPHKDFFFKKYIGNTSWMLSERIFKTLSSFLIGVFVAKYLGPEKFGNLNYVIAFVAIFIPIAEMGYSTILLRELSSLKKHKRNQVISTAFYLNLLVSVFVLVIIWAIVGLGVQDSELAGFISIYAIVVLFKPFSIIDYHYQSQINAKKSSIIKTVTLIVTSVVKLILILAKANLKYFIFAYLLDIILASIFFILIYWLEGNSFLKNTLDFKIARRLLKSSWPMVLSSLSIILYMRMDQIMIKNMINASELGLYSVSVRVYEGIIMISTVASTSILPALVILNKESEDRFEIKLIGLFRILFWGNMILALFITIFDDNIVLILFGEQYERAATTMSILMWTAGLASLGSLTSRYFTVKKMEKKLALRTFLSLLINLLLNYWLIPIYGINGSAIATGISLLIGNYLIDYLDKDLSKLIKAKNKALFKWVLR